MGQLHHIAEHRSSEDYHGKLVVQTIRGSYVWYVWYVWYMWYVWYVW